MPSTNWRIESQKQLAALNGRLAFVPHYDAAPHCRGYRHVVPLVYLIALSALPCLAYTIRRYLYIDPDAKYCSAFGYDLRGCQADAACPECGRA